MRSSSGFTLLECLLVLALLASLLSWAVPNFQNIMDSRNTSRFATELMGLVYLAKSEAVLRNQDLWLQFQPTQEESDALVIELTDSSEATGEVISTLTSEHFRHVVIENNYQDNKVKFYARRGKMTSGSIIFYSSLQPNKRLKLITSFGAGRIRLCAVDGSAYGYSNCE